MKFRYEFAVKKLPWPINHHHKLLLIGSCFTENIGEKLDKAKFTTLQNPHGILFNPVSVAEAMNDYLLDRRYTTNDLFCLNEAWHSWKHHSRYSGITPEETVQKINASTTAAHAFVKDVDFVVITLGSSWTYTLTEKAFNGKSGSVAANNHKAPSDWFNRKLLGAEEVTAILENALHQLFLQNSSVKVIFTISPVRHLREGVIENNRSKAVLIQAVHHLVEKFEQLYYFPAYELVIDDLRDYRYYSEDLVHPNYFATQYVWEKLVEACMDEQTKLIMEELHSIQLGFQHKAFNPSSEQHKKFMQSFFMKASRLQEQHPHLHLKREIDYFSQH